MKQNRKRFLINVSNRFNFVNSELIYANVKKVGEKCKNLCNAMNNKSWRVEKISVYILASALTQKIIATRRNLR